MKRFAFLIITLVACSKTANDSAQSTPSPAAAPSTVATSNAVAPAPTITPSSLAAAVSQPSVSAPPARNALSDVYIVKTDSVLANVTFHVFVNGEQQGDYAASDADSDITPYFHRGRNTLRVTWDSDRSSMVFGVLTVGRGRGGHFSTLLSVNAGNQHRPHGQLAITAYAR